MGNTLILPGISHQSIKTDRLRTAYLQAGEGEIPLILLHGNCASSFFFQDFMLALARTGRYRIYAPDLRGFGYSERLPIDATRGACEFSDDLAALIRYLEIPPFHLFGWSLGGNVAIQYALDYPGMVRSLILQATGSPFGLGGTRDEDGTPIWPDFAGSGGGAAASPEFVQRLASGDRGQDRFSPRTILKMLYFSPVFALAAEQEERLLSALLMTAVGPEYFPGAIIPSSYWPLVAPGEWGMNNAFSPKYLDQRAFITLREKPPVLWVHGTHDQIVSDTSLIDFGVLGQQGLVPGWPGLVVYPPQPMKKQIHRFLRTYQEHGGRYQEVVLQECGHTPHLEKPEEMLQVLLAFLEEQEG
ncbi:alpha/beta fold hydrolase [Tengunoibacter tsumagoiensis]|uniref:Alpha/beta hydrolase n=1 Tax=Tengunoibacter tsumagoiensis TaxID=2014871 RepID=A0A402A8G3_9CHLR|nr:alpha/beta hydrolase [Tengunoibacter tsumagoiensis]GCE15440.1 alpha/beta hydrolase [Tengunoibacter tsumagoiensis]